MSESTAFDELINALDALPGVGPKAAQRMAYHLLHRDPDVARKLSTALQNAIQRIRLCEQCNTYAETEICSLCANFKRDHSVLCVVETPADLLTIERTQAFNGVYFVLMGHLSPLDGIGPGDIHLAKLMERLKDHQIKEVILATNFTNEGESTAYYIAEMLKGKPIAVTRIAKGMPAGSEVEYADVGTLAQAVMERRPLSQ